MISSNLTLDSTAVEAIRAQARARNYSEEEIQARLEQAGLVQSPQGLGDQFKRGAGLIGRMAVQAAGGLAGIPFGLAGAGYQAVTGNEPPAMLRPQGVAAADQLGLPKPETPQERILSAGVEGGLQGAVFPGSAAVNVGLGGASMMAGQGAAEAGADPMAQMAAQAVVGVGMPIVGTVAAAATRAAIAGSTSRREAARQAAALMQAGDPSAPMTLGQVVQTNRAKIVEGGLRNMPGANMVFADALEKQAQGLGQRVQGAANSVAPVRDKTVVGKIVQKGIEQGFVPRFRATSRKLYNDVELYVPGESPVTMGSTARLMAEHNDLIKTAPAGKDLFATPFMQKWGDDFAALNESMPEGVPYKIVKAMRTRLGNILDGSEAVPDINIAEVDRLYGALSDDMARTVGEVGGEHGLAAWSRASTYWKAGKDRLQNVLQPLLDKKTPEIAYNALMSGTRDGGTILRTTMRSLGPEERKIVTSSVIGKMGMASPGGQNAAGDVFSPDMFLTRWNSLSPVAKGALFDGVSPTISKNLDALAKAMENVKKANKVMRNPAGTATNVAFLGITGALGTTSPKHAAMGLGVAATGDQLAKRVFTNPNAVDWLVKTTKFPIGAIGPQLVLLAKEADKWDPDSRDVALDLVEFLQGVNWSEYLMGKAIEEHVTAQ